MHEHAHNKRGLLGALEGLQNTKHFGAKRRARHKNAKSDALYKKTHGEKKFPF